MPRAPETTDGRVLEGLTHGKRSTYNKGCHCMRCRAANAAAQQRVRDRRKANKENQSDG